jgi:hypothetical protein
MKISPSMLMEYGERHGIDLNLEEEWENIEKYALHVLGLLEKEPIGKQGDFWMDIDDIDSMSKKEACEYLCNKLHERGTPLSDQTFEEFKFVNQQAMYFYLHHKDLFYETFDSYSLDMKQGWRGRKTVAIPLKEFIDNIEDFKKALKELYSREYKGKKVKIRYTDKGDRVIFTAHIQDVYTTDIEFEQESENLNTKKPRKPVFPLNFLYRPAEGVLEVKAQGGKSRTKELQHIFIEDFLKADPSELAKLPRFDFDKVQSLAELDFPLTAQDKAESVTLKGLKLVNKENRVKITIYIDPEDETGVEPMMEALEERRIDLNEFEVKQFKLKVLFKQGGKGRQRSVTTTITHPDGCNLKQREIDVIVYQLLKKWGLVFY